MIINDLEVEVLRKNNKNMHLYVLPPNGVIRVSAPQQIDDETIRLFVLTKIGWIKSQIKRYKNQTRQSSREYVSGESHYLWGRRYRLKVVEDTATTGLSIISNTLTLVIKKGTIKEKRKAIFNKMYRNELKEKIPYLIDLWQKRIGVVVSSWQIKNMRTKWGTCNIAEKRIWINLQLAKKPIECLEYVIIHELCHFIQKNHSRAFSDLMDKYLPGWQAIRKQLNDFIMDAFEEKWT
ncbi:MAG: M48 family metallopeptidase [Treponema sp.]|nr:M48 family metallopeptidase [Treponema sp.]